MPWALNRSNKRRIKNIRVSSGMLTVTLFVCSKEPCSREQPRSRRLVLGTEVRADFRFFEKVCGVQTEVVARRPARIGMGWIGSRSLLPDITLTDVRRRALTEAAFSPASRIHWRENVGLTSNTA